MKEYIVAVNRLNNIKFLGHLTSRQAEAAAKKYKVVYSFPADFYLNFLKPEWTQLNKIEKLSYLASRHREIIL